MDLEFEEMTLTFWHIPKYIDEVNGFKFEISEIMDSVFEKNI